MLVYFLALETHRSDERVNFEFQGVPTLESGRPFGLEESDDTPAPVFDVVLRTQAQQRAEFLQRQ